MWVKTRRWGRYGGGGEEGKGGGVKEAGGGVVCAVREEGGVGLRRRERGSGGRDGGLGEERGKEVRGERMEA
eukprot:COSAG02_NODE_1090_length_14647_cov_122.569425_11_plen_72_part_00